MKSLGQAITQEERAEIESRVLAHMMSKQPKEFKKWMEAKAWARDYKSNEIPELNPEWNSEEKR